MTRREALALLAVPKVPRRSPELAVARGGAQVLLSEYRGKVVLVAFLVTRCKICPRAVETLSALQKEYAPRGFQALGTLIDEMAETLIGDFLVRHRPRFPLGHTRADSAREYLAWPPGRPVAVPVFVFVDRKGTIQAQHDGSGPFFREDLKNARAVVERLLTTATAR
ncbi:MAG: redoxin domain-containing protein [Bryobacteraceae bacterium]